jgi:hypothetical protein
LQTFAKKILYFFLQASSLMMSFFIVALREVVGLDSLANFPGRDRHQTELVSTFSFFFVYSRVVGPVLDPLQ